MLVVLMAFCLIICNCRYDKIYINREQDNYDGKMFLNKFYSDVANKNYYAIDTLVGDSLKKMAGVDGISKMVKFINHKVGNYKKYIIDDFYIRNNIGTDKEISYNYKLKVIYDKGIVDEIIGLKKLNCLNIKINSYHANSDLLIH